MIGKVWKQPLVKKIEVESLRKLDPKLSAKLVNSEYRMALYKLVLAAIMITFGFVIIVMGIQSDAIIKIDLTIIDFESNKAFPGTIFCILGFTLAHYARMNLQEKPKK